MAIIYMGSMDDRVYRYPWPFFLKKKILINSYISSILKNTIIGHKSAINDGYLLANPILRDSLFSENDSILRNILCTGEVVIPGRRSTFEELIAEQIENKIDTFINIPQQTIQQLAKVDKQLNNFGARVSGPASSSIWQGFYELMSTLQNKSAKELGISGLLVSDYDFKLAINSFFALPHNTKPPSRTQWEMVLTKLSQKHAGSGGFTAGENTKLALMNLGNEAYHYNFSQKFAEHSGNRVDIETVNTPAFSHLLDKKKLDVSTLVEDLPLIQIPKFNSLLEPGSIEDLLDNSTDVGRMRIEFINVLRAFEENANDANLKELKFRSNIYNLLLNQRFGKPNSLGNFADSANFTLSIFTGVGTYLFDPTGVTSSIISGVLSWVITTSGSRILTNKFVTENPNAIDYQKYILASSKMKST